MINLTVIFNGTDQTVLGIVQGLNSGLNYMVGFGLLVTIFIILFASTYKTGVKQALGFASTGVVIIALLFRLMSLINDQILYACIVIEVVSMLILFFAKQD